MIILDCSETRSNSITNITGDNVKTCNWLEERTGADLMITPLSLPLVPATFEKHLKSGALLVQVKHGSDFTNSIGERLNTSIAKMVECGELHYWQRVLVVTGMFVPDTETGNMLVGTVETNKNGKVFVRWMDSGKDSKACYSALRHWGFRGGLPLQLSTVGDFDNWCQETDRDLKYLLDNPTKEVWPSNPQLYDPPVPDDPLQLPVRVNDFRVTLATFPGIGPVRANEMWKELGGNGGKILCWLSDPRDMQVKKVGTKTVEEIQRYLDLDCFRLTMEVRPELVAKRNNGNG